MEILSFLIAFSLIGAFQTQEVVKFGKNSRFLIAIL